MQCQTCLSSRRIFDPIMYMSVPVRNEKQEELTELQDCLKEYFKEENLVKDNQIECEKCLSK